MNWEQHVTEHMDFSFRYGETEAKPHLRTITLQERTPDAEQLEELDNYELTAAQRENDHNLQFRIEYQYASDDRNELTVELDGVKIFTLQNCEELLQGALGFGPVLVNMSVTELSLVYTDAVPPETETPETGDAPSSAAAAAILCGAVMLFTVLSPGKRRRFN